MKPFYHYFLSVLWFCSIAEGSEQLENSEVVSAADQIETLSESEMGDFWLSDFEIMENLATVPEPAAVLLGAIGFFVLIRRR